MILTVLFSVSFNEDVLMMLVWVLEVLIAFKTLFELTLL